MEKSHVGMGHKVCPVCGTEHDEVVLLDRHLRKTLERDMFMGYELCPTHAAEGKEHDAVFLIEVDSTKHFTGKTARLAQHVAAKVFNVPLGAHPFAFIEPGVLEKLESMVER